MACYYARFFGLSLVLIFKNSGIVSRDVVVRAEEIQVAFFAGMGWRLLTLSTLTVLFAMIPIQSYLILVICRKFSVHHESLLIENTTLFLSIVHRCVNGR